MERVTRIERATFSLATKGSTAELHPHLVFTSYIIYFCVSIVFWYLCKHLRITFLVTPYSSATV